MENQKKKKQQKILYQPSYLTQADSFLKFYRKGREYTRRVPLCHPERKHKSNGLCEKCLAKWYYHHKGQREKQSEYYKKNKDRVLKICKEYRQKNQVKIRAKYLGVSEDGVRMALKQKRCWICGCDKKLVIDHDHNTNIVRGRLCSVCNSAIGYFKDDIKLLRRAIKYLTQ